MIQSTSNIYILSSTCRTEPLSVLCQHCRSVAFSMVLVYLACYTTSHSPYYICPFLQNPVAEWAQGHEGFHSNDPSRGHHNVCKAKASISNAPRNLHVSPMIMAVNPFRAF